MKRRTAMHLRQLSTSCADGRPPRPQASRYLHVPPAPEVCRHRPRYPLVLGRPTRCLSPPSRGGLARQRRASACCLLSAQRPHSSPNLSACCACAPFRCPLAWRTRLYRAGLLFPLDGPLRPTSSPDPRVKLL
ncbi:hypothetical protein BD413DRAFT_122300 [Trametes elegans]|nr:hypothetical protein BD413DRAFT_122300 [Trametes elegans]